MPVVTNSQDQPAAANPTNQTVADDTLSSNNSSSSDSSSPVGSVSSSSTDPATNFISQTAAQAPNKKNTNQTSGTGSSSGVVSGQQTNPVAGSSETVQVKTGAEVSQQTDPAQTAKPVESIRRKVANYVAAIGVVAIILWLIIEYLKRKRKMK